MKSKVYNFVFWLISLVYNLLNFKSKSVFVFTDSRGYDVLRKVGKNPFKSYIKGLIKNYRTTYLICPEKFTTILDFLIAYEGTSKRYDFVILHCGIVDFSPRPLSNIEKVKRSKSGIPVFDDLFQFNGEYHKIGLGPKYYGEELTTLYSKEYFLNLISPRLKSIENLIWINSNNFVSNWDGNYSKGRPENISSVVSSFEQLMECSVSHLIDLKKWSDQEVKQFTIDNIHFTETGFSVLENLVLSKMNKL